VKELVKRWYPGDFSRQPKKKLSHRALDDILESIEELKYYRREVFKEPKSKTKVEKE
jgi:oligoribonuclease